MSLYDKFEQLRPKIKDYLDISIDYNNQSFPGNREGTCTSQVLYWFMGLAGQLPSGTGLKESLLSPYQKATTLHFGGLQGGDLDISRKSADKVVDLTGTKSAEMIKNLTPWTGTYKLYGLTSSKGDAHALGAYFPMFGKVQFYDPNLVVGQCKEDKWIYELLFTWTGVYYGSGGNNDGTASWQFTDLRIFSDPKKVVDQLKNL